MASQQQMTTVATESEGSETELVSEFPPPPYYYKNSLSLIPPPIPTDAIERSTNQSIIKKRALETEERMRLRGDVIVDGMRGLAGVVPGFRGKIDGPTITIFGDGSYLEVRLIIVLLIPTSWITEEVVLFVFRAILPKTTYDPGP